MPYGTSSRRKRHNLIRRQSRNTAIASFARDVEPESLADGLRFCILCVIFDFSRECLAIIVICRSPVSRVAQELDRITDMCGFPSIFSPMLRAKQKRGQTLHV